MFSRKRTQTPEEAYQARDRQQRASELRRRAYAADQEAQRWQMSADVYGRPDRDYSDPTTAHDASERGLPSAC